MNRVRLGGFVGFVVPVPNDSEWVIALCWRLLGYLYDLDVGVMVEDVDFFTSTVFKLDLEEVTKVERAGEIHGRTQ